MNRTITSSLLYGAQVTTGYLMMLIAMTYSAEIFTMVVLGLTTGYAIFNLELPIPKNTDPCCAEENDLEVKDDQKRNDPKQSLLH